MIRECYKYVIISIIKLSIVYKCYYNDNPQFVPTYILKLSSSRCLVVCIVNVLSTYSCRTLVVESIFIKRWDWKCFVSVYVIAIHSWPLNKIIHRVRVLQLFFFTKLKSVLMMDICIQIWILIYSKNKMMHIVHPY